jgi:hypothetical protein
MGEIINHHQMLKRTYIIFVAGCTILIVGIVLSALSIWVLLGNTIIKSAIISPFNTITKVFEVSNLDRNVSLYLHREIEAHQSLEFFITDPNGNSVSIYEVPMLYFFKPNLTGNYTLFIINTGSTSIIVDGVFGYIPLFNFDNYDDLEFDDKYVVLYQGIRAGSILITIGIIVVMVGIIYLILNRSGKVTPSIS